jgi:hypothetical protein
MAIIEFHYGHTRFVHGFYDMEPLGDLAIKDIFIFIREQLARRYKPDCTCLLLLMC